MSAEELFPDHAACVLGAREQIEVLQQAVAAVGLPGLSLAEHLVDLDIPIPLVQKLDLFSGLVIEHADGKGSSWLCVDMWGDCYACAYGMRVRIGPDAILESPTERLDPLGDFRAGLAKLARMTQRIYPEADVRRALAAAIPWPLRDFFELYLAKELDR